METNDITQAELAVAKAWKTLCDYETKNRFRLATANASTQARILDRKETLQNKWFKAEDALFNLINN